MLSKATDNTTLSNIDNITIVMRFIYDKQYFYHRKPFTLKAKKNNRTNTFHAFRFENECFNNVVDLLEYSVLVIITIVFY